MVEVRQWRISARAAAALAVAAAPSVPPLGWSSHWPSLRRRVRKAAAHQARPPGSAACGTGPAQRRSGHRPQSLCLCALLFLLWLPSLRRFNSQLLRCAVELWSLAWPRWAARTTAVMSGARRRYQQRPSQPLTAAERGGLSRTVAEAVHWSPVQLSDGQSDDSALPLCLPCAVLLLFPHHQLSASCRGAQGPLPSL